MNDAMNNDINSFLQPSLFVDSVFCGNLVFLQYLVSTVVRMASDRLFTNEETAHLLQNPINEFLEEAAPATSDPISCVTIPDVVNTERPKEEVTLEKACNDVQAEIQSFDTALGLLICCSSDYKKDHNDNRIKTFKGSNLMKDAFRSLGYATCCFHISHAEVFIDLCTKLTDEMEYPPSYKRLFFYVCAHGTKEHIWMGDNFVRVQEIVWKFRPISAVKLKIPRVVLFETCRGNMPGNVDESQVLPMIIRSPEFSPDIFFDDVMVFFSSQPGFKSYGSVDGVPLVTEIIYQHLKQPHKSKNLCTLLSVDVRNSLRELSDKHPELLNICPDCTLNLREEIDLHAECRIPMQPTQARLQQIGSYSYMSWTKPLHATRQDLQDYDIAVQKPDLGLCLVKTVGKNKTSERFLSHDMIGGKVFLIANYNNTTVPSVSVEVTTNIREKVLRFIKYTMGALLLILFLFAFVYTLLTRLSLENRQILGIAGDAIECSNPGHLQRLSSIEIDEVVADEEGDNPEGLQMSVIPCSKRNIGTIMRDFTDSNLNEKQELNKQNYLLIPLLYYNRPWYMWCGSSIHVTYSFVHHDKVHTTVAYLLRGEENFNHFYSHEDFQYEMKRDLLQGGNINEISWKVNKTGYYYVGVYTDTEGAALLYNVTFNVRNIDPAKLCPNNTTCGKPIGEIGHKVTFTHSLQSPNTNHTLCYLHEVYSQTRNSIHIRVSIKPQLLATVIPLVLLLVLCAVPSISYCLFCSKIPCICSSRIKNPVLINNP